MLTLTHSIANKLNNGTLTGPIEKISAAVKSYNDMHTDVVLQAMLKQDFIKIERDAAGHKIFTTTTRIDSRDIARIARDATILASKAEIYRD